MRKGLEERENSGHKASLPSDSASGAMDSHMRGAKKEEDNRKMREAFGLGDNFTAGESFDQEAQERKKAARKRCVYRRVLYVGVKGGAGGVGVGEATTVFFARRGGGADDFPGWGRSSGRYLARGLYAARYPCEDLDAGRGPS